MTSERVSHKTADRVGTHSTEKTRKQTAPERGQTDRISLTLDLQSPASYDHDLHVLTFVMVLSVFTNLTTMW